jgi:hypothetical protein
MTNQIWLPSEEEALANYLAEQVCLRASGRLEDECLRNYPRDVYFVGNLRPMPSAETEFTDPTSPAWLGELLNKIAPVGFGAEYLLEIIDQEAEVEVELKWSCYYRVFPTFAQQQAHQRLMGGENSAKTSNLSSSSPVVSPNEEEDAEGFLKAKVSSDSELTPQDRKSDRQSRETLFIRFRKVNCSASGKVKIIQE